MLLLLASVCISLHLEELTGKFKNCRLAGSKWLAATVTAAKLVLRWRLVVGFESQKGHSTDLCTFYHFNSFSIYSKKMHFAVRNRRRNMNKWKVDKDISNHSLAHSGLPLCQGTDCSRPCPCISCWFKVWDPDNFSIFSRTVIVQIGQTDQLRSRPGFISNKTVQYHLGCHLVTNETGNGFFVKIKGDGAAKGAPLNLPAHAWGNVLHQLASVKPTCFWMRPATKVGHSKNRSDQVSLYVSFMLSWNKMYVYYSICIYIQWRIFEYTYIESHIIWILQKSHHVYICISSFSYIMYIYNFIVS